MSQLRREGFMRSNWIISVVVAIGFVAQAFAQDVNQDLRQEAEKLIFAYAATFNKQDAAALAAFYTKDGVIINQRGVMRTISNRRIPPVPLQGRL
jgi:hypothetical protein